MADYTGLAQYISDMNQALAKTRQKVANDPVVAGLANAVVTNPVVESIGSYIKTKTPLEVANDVASIGAIAAASANPYTAIPTGLARFSPRVVSGAIQSGKEWAENVLSDLAMSQALDAGLVAEDTKDILKAIKRR